MKKIFIALFTLSLLGCATNDEETSSGPRRLGFVQSVGACGDDLVYACLYVTNKAHRLDSIRSSDAISIQMRRDSIEHLGGSKFLNRLDSLSKNAGTVLYTDDNRCYYWNNEKTPCVPFKYYMNCRNRTSDTENFGPEVYAMLCKGD